MEAVEISSSIITDYYCSGNNGRELPMIGAQIDGGTDRRTKGRIGRTDIILQDEFRVFEHHLLRAVVN